MQKQVQKLTQFIKPSSPTEQTRHKLNNNTIHWMKHTMHILQEHYTQTIISLMEHIQVFKDPEWTVALKWAKKRFKHKLIENTIKYCSSTIQNKQSTFTRQGPTSYATAHRASPPQTVSHSTHQHPPSFPVLSTGDPTHASKREILVTAQVHHRQVSPVQSLKSTITVVKKTNSPSSSLCRSGSTPEEEDDHTGETMAKTVTTSGENDGDTAETTARQKGIRMRGRREEKSSPPETRSESSLRSKPLAVAKPSRVSSDSSDEELLDRVPLRDTPYRHINTNRKASDWSISIHKPIVFIGDGNLNRIPSIKNTNIQIDSFPEANFLHLTKVLRKLSPHPHTQQIALAAGIHNRHQLPYKTAIKQLQGLWKAAYTAFPNATVHTALVPYSWSLPDQEQQNLEVLNEYIASHENPLLAESQDLFKVEKDGICWTTDTAQAIFDYWVEQLDP
ncbi:hypothetical protein Q7C36_013959 [Tachysurus vachellii]|uniref:Uncharacterized protein n=1 Tax=Tachysurus vachellii TaxID=175792 RepID=A0AA88SIS8_TACVA|nr:hypothetical protein Q7C36_013959 [Tachysurus vachellii]